MLGCNILLRLINDSMKISYFWLGVNQLQDMNILLVSATIAEVQPLIDKYNFKKIGDNRYFEEISDHQIQVIITGVGMVQTAYWVGKELTENHYYLAINAGVAGCFDKSFPLASVVNVTSEEIPELGADDGENFIPISQMSFQEETGYPFSKPVIEVEHPFSNEIINELPKVKGITVNTVSGNENKIELLKNTFKPVMESMEGGAFFYACNKEKVKTLQIRAVSNYVEPRNHNNWKVNEAIIALNEKLIGIIHAIEE